MTEQLTSHATNPALGISGFHYADLYNAARLADLLGAFDDSINRHDAALFSALTAYRACGGDGMKPEAVSELLVTVAPYVGRFVAQLFSVTTERDQQMQAIRGDMDSVFVYRSEIVGKLASRFKGQSCADWDVDALHQQLQALLAAAGLDSLWTVDAEKAVSQLAADCWRQSQQADSNDAVASALDVIYQWSFAAQQHPAIAPHVAGWLSFKVPQKTNLDNLVAHQTVEQAGYMVWACDDDHHRRRDGFALTDKRFNQRQTLYEVDHCIYCHDRDNDSCSKGIKNKKDGSFKLNHLNALMIGCPLEEKISEMHVVKRQGDNRCWPI